MAHDLGEVRSWMRRQVRPSEVDAVAREVAREFGVPEHELRGPSRRRPVYAARKEALRRLAKPNVSLASIARAWPCDHTTVCYSLGRLSRTSVRASAISR